MTCATLRERKDGELHKFLHVQVLYPLQIPQPGKIRGFAMVQPSLRLVLLLAVVLLMAGCSIWPTGRNQTEAMLPDVPTGQKTANPWNTATGEANDRQWPVLPRRFGSVVRRITSMMNWKTRIV